MFNFISVREAFLFLTLSQSCQKGLFDMTTRGDFGFIFFILFCLIIMKEVTVRCVNADWVYTFQLDCLQHFNFGHLKDLCERVNPKLFGDTNEIFIYSGIILPANDVTLDVLLAIEEDSSIEVSVFLVDKSVVLPAGYIQMDKKSFIAAKKYLNELPTDKKITNPRSSSAEWGKLVESLIGKRLLYYTLLSFTNIAYDG